MIEKVVCGNIAVMLLTLWRLLQSRIDRSHFAAYLLIGTAVMYILLYRFDRTHNDSYFFLWGMYFAFVTILAVRRLHDLDFRGWWSLALPLMFFGRSAILLSCGWGGCDSVMTQLYNLIPWVGGALVLPLVVVAGTRGSNRFLA